jgi:hypothetical protein
LEEDFRQGTVEPFLGSEDIIVTFGYILAVQIFLLHELIKKTSAEVTEGSQDLHTPVDMLLRTEGVEAE